MRLTTTTSLLLSSTLTFVRTQRTEADLPDTPNPKQQLSNCQLLGCEGQDNVICSPNADNPGGFQPGIGIAPQILSLGGGNNLSLTLIDGLEVPGFTAGTLGESYEYSDQQLFVGLPDNQSDGPTGCLLMLQYNGQTFAPRENARDDSEDITTSCAGVVDRFCQADIYDAITSFRSSSSGSNDDDGETEKCEELANHVSARLRGQFTCGNDRIGSFINITAGALPSSGGADQRQADHRRLGEGRCKPVLPTEYSLYKVAEMRQWVFNEAPSSGSDFYKPLFGGRSGFTPVISVAYPPSSGNGSGNNGNNNNNNSTSEDEEKPEVQFVCMKTFTRDMKAVPDQFGSTSGAVAVAGVQAGRGAAAVAVVAVAVSMFLF